MALTFNTTVQIAVISSVSFIQNLRQESGIDLKSQFS